MIFKHELAFMTRKASKFSGSVDLPLFSEFQTNYLLFYLCVLIASKPAKYVKNIGSSRGDYDERGLRKLNGKYHSRSSLKADWFSDHDSLRV